MLAKVFAAKELLYLQGETGVTNLRVSEKLEIILETRNMNLEGSQNTEI